MAAASIPARRKATCQRASFDSRVGPLSSLPDCAAGGIIPAAACLAVDPRPDAAAAPATQPAKAIDPAIRALIVKLGDDDPAVRDDATRKLSDLGKAAVPALREAAAGDDLEASAAPGTSSTTSSGVFRRQPRLETAWAGPSR